MGLRDITLHDLIRRNAAVYGGRPAWIEADDGRALTFAEVAERVERLAAGLQRRGVRKGDRVGVLGKNSLEFFLLYGAAAACGAIVLPVNWRLSPEEAAFNLADGRPRLLFVDAEYQELVGAHRGRLSSVEACFNLKPPGGGFERFDGSAGDRRRVRPGRRGRGRRVDHHPHRGRGRPAARGARVPPQPRLRRVQLNLLLQMTPADVHLNLLPLFHVGGLFMAVQSFCAGALNVNMGRFDAAAAAELIERHRVTVLFDFAPILGEHPGPARERRAQARLAAAGDRAGAARGDRTLPEADGRDVLLHVRADRDRGHRHLRPVRRAARVGRPPGAVRAGGAARRGRPSGRGRVRSARSRSGGRSSSPATGICPRTPPGPSGAAGTTPATWGASTPTATSSTPAASPTRSSSSRAARTSTRPRSRRPSCSTRTWNARSSSASPTPKWKEAVKAVCQLKPGRQLAAADLIAFVGGRIASFKKPRHVEFVAALPLAADGSPDRKKIKDAHGGASG